MTSELDGSQPYSHLAHANDVEPSFGHRHLREHCPLHVEETHDPPFYVLSRHADVFDVLMRPGEWRNGSGVGIEPSDREHPGMAGYEIEHRSPVVGVP